MCTPTVASKASPQARAMRIYGILTASPWCGAVAAIIFFDTRI
jgi:hypothetical protein